MADTPQMPRIAPLSYNARGNPVHTWTLTPSHITDPVHCILPPDGVLPVIFVPGIMGSNLKSKPEKGKGKNKAAPVWRLDAGFMGKNMWLALNWINKKAGIRQQLLHPARVEVDNKGAVAVDYFARVGGAWWLPHASACLWLQLAGLQRGGRVKAG
ncbi:MULTISPECIES: hypothetical protein [unclassified Pseudomonas]|uniref:hypothetical protein n=1 Tax=unclassified Pseudomonas TaxID=196821 RepID=UPI002113A2B1|nr:MULTISPECIES: hypothetical protein [unclassified Pseudomonas]